MPTSASKSMQGVGSWAGVGMGQIEAGNRVVLAAVSYFLSSSWPESPTLGPCGLAPAKLSRLLWITLGQGENEFFDHFSLSKNESNIIGQ